ncbi:PRTRC system ThiF family protein [Ornithobacterium rhinotracheale]|uniref:PRTRC system ThiF family protein n=1 Tax=Ornithobacterium rhinotracheale TaxID=28251 RepID=UPI00129C618D|nr:PRTRC system ThiF family protein [Ornithobacterium rhinotracheale]MRI64572.1 PRTRC system ThiF family protein [Ornithobacterium rhinotracheale]
METKDKIHYTDNSLINATNPITIHLIGAGGTGSQVLTALARMNTALIELGHAGFALTLWDDDTISQANLGRQLFAESEVGMYKSIALINRVNRFFGTNWKAKTIKFAKDCQKTNSDEIVSNLYISCVDSVNARFEIANIIKDCSKNSSHFQRNKPLYWLDFGNSQSSGQVILSTIGKHEQPKSNKYQPIGKLPFITDEFADLLKQSEEIDDTPSCSLAEALHKQDLFINSTLAQMGTSLLWGMFRNGFVKHRGFFLNLKDYRTQPLPL